MISSSWRVAGGIPRCLRRPLRGRRPPARISIATRPPSLRLTLLPAHPTSIRPDKLLHYSLYPPSTAFLPTKLLPRQTKKASPIRNTKQHLGHKRELDIDERSLGLSENETRCAWFPVCINHPFLHFPNPTVKPNKLARVKASLQTTDGTFESLYTVRAY